MGDRQKHAPYCGKEGAEGLRPLGAGYKAWLQDHQEENFPEMGHSLGVVTLLLQGGPLCYQ